MIHLHKSENDSSGLWTIYPFRLWRGTTQIGGVYFITYRRNHVQDRDSAFGKSIKQTVAAITRLIYSDICVGSFVCQADSAFFRLDIHPGNITKVSFEFGICESLTRDRIVIVVFPYIVLCSVNTVLPYTVRSGTQPAFADSLMLPYLRNWMWKKTEVIWLLPPIIN